MTGVYALVAVPAALILTIGIVILVYRRTVFDVTMGLLLVSFCAAIGAGAALTLAGIRSDRKLAALQVDFVSKVSHELKTPLTSIRMFVETLRLGRVKEPEQVERCLDVIEKETERLSTLIGRLLSWGAMEAGAFRVSPEATTVAALVDRAVSAFAPQNLSGELSLEVTVPEGLPPILADVPALVDALLNLLNNAKKYGGDSNRIELFAEERPEGTVAISVRDFGIGIEAKHHKRIFERFYRADERYSQNASGTGLGLAIARHVVLAHQGQIEVKSKRGEGSTFTIVLPTIDATLKNA